MTASDARETASRGKRPSHRAYVVVGEGEASNWREIGAAWAHADGKGFTVALDAAPMSGSLVLRVNAPKEVEGGRA